MLGIWVAGGAFGLNPLGEDGPMLGQIVLSELPPQTFVRARIVAGTALGAPFVIAGTAVLTVRDLSLTDAFVAGGAWLALLPVSGAIAVGVGTLLPRWEPSHGPDTQTRSPETLAVLVHAAVTGLLAVGVAGSVSGMTGLFAVDVGGSIADVFGFSEEWMGLAAGAVAALLAADLCYRFAVAGIRNHGQPERFSVFYVLELSILVSVLGLVLSITAPMGVTALVQTSSSTGALLSALAEPIGWATAALVYLFVSAHSETKLRVVLPDRRAIGFAAAGVCVTAVVAGGLAATDAKSASFLAESALSQQAAVDDRLGTLTAAVVALLSAASIEFLFRTVIQQRTTAATGLLPSVFVVSVLFTSVHAAGGSAFPPAQNLVAFGVLFVVSLIWGWVYDRSGSLVAPVLSHGCFGIVLLTL